MFNLLPLRRIITTFAIINVFILFILIYFISPSTIPLGFVRYISITITILDIITFLITVYFWRFIWRYIPLLSQVYFPDINGIWQGKIIFNTESEQKALDAKVRIKQNLWQINMNLCSTTSRSYTLVAYPSIEAGNHKLYYIYQNTPKNPQYSEYKGTAIMNVRLEAQPMQLTGFYYTSRGTRGQIELSQISVNPNEEYEF